MIDKVNELQLGKMVRLIAGIAGVALLVQFLMKDGAADLVVHLRNIDVASWGILCATSIAILCVLSILFKISISVVNVELDYKTALNYTAMNTYFNTVLPMKGGLWVRGIYLKRFFDVSWSSYLFVMATGQLIQLLILATIAIVFYVTNDIPINVPTIPIRALVVSLFAVVIFLVLLAAAKRSLIKTTLRKTRNGLRLWIADPKLLGHYLVGTVLFHALTGFRLWLAFYLVGVTLSVPEIALLYATMAAGLSWAVTPGNIGIKEATIVVLATFIGIDPDAAIAASVVDRIASLIITVAVGGTAAYRVSSSTAKK